MDLDTVTSLRPARRRTDLALGPGEAVLAGGTWLFSEPQDHLTGLVDLTTLGWEPLARRGGVLEIAATCTIEQVLGLDAPLVRRCAEAFLMSGKVWRAATVGGNVALALPAGAMISLLTALDAVAVVWTPDGGERREPVADLVIGAGATTLRPGEVLRSFELSVDALEAPAAFRRASLTSLGRSAAVVVGRRDGAGLVVGVTAATTRPHVLRYPDLPTATDLAERIAAIADWYDDPHGAPDWRAAVTAHLAEEVRRELGGTP